ncbi:hypothetical protein DERF_007799 [Dermatophagoides farinae]|uniref:Uncharacterized protein n=1 Tax=Dermatophagoides farinae TaxID=6954 RepID=A0A922I064_DERFA|nr:hypothetical protein DERF_007799 [Dermatophagoides farinae]
MNRAHAFNCSTHALFSMNPSIQGGSIICIELFPLSLVVIDLSLLSISLDKKSNLSSTTDLRRSSSGVLQINLAKRSISLRSLITVVLNDFD